MGTEPAVTQAGGPRMHLHEVSPAAVDPTCQQSGGGTTCMLVTVHEAPARPLTSLCCRGLRHVEIECKGRQPPLAACRIYQMQQPWPCIPIPRRACWEGMQTQCKQPVRCSKLCHEGPACTIRPSKRQWYLLATSAKRPSTAPT